MATPSGPPNAGLIPLARAPARFDFHQAVRLLEWSAVDPEGGRPAELGEDGVPRNEPVRFHAHPSLEFSATDVVAMRRLPEDAAHPAPPWDMTVSFLGLIGPNGALPHHYTKLVLERLHVRHKDPTLGEFLDLFTHRHVSFFHRAWEKYRLGFAHERARRERNDLDPITSALFAVVGRGFASLRDRTSIDERSFLHYGGHFGQYPRCAANLRAILADYFGVAVEIEQFRGRWLRLDPTQCSRMAGGSSAGANTALGESLVSGTRVWDVQSMFRVRIGPLTYAQYAGFLPTGEAFTALRDLIRAYVGIGHDFDVSCVLRAEEAPPFSLARDAEVAPLLGWNTWSRSRDFEDDVSSEFRAESE